MKIQVYSQRDQVAVHELHARIFTPQERTKRALLRFLSFLALALVSILIPVFHFVLVPLFLLLAPFLGYKTYKEEVILEALEISCPECHQPAAFAKTSGQWPLHAICPHCRNRIYFELAPLNVDEKAPLNPEV